MPRKKKKFKRISRTPKTKRVRSVRKITRLSPTQRLVIAVILFTLAIILFLGLLDLAGVAGEFITLGLEMLFGWASWLVPVIFVLAGLISAFYKRGEEIAKKSLVYRGVALLVMVLSVAGALHIRFVDDQSALEALRGGGYIGYGLSFITVKTFGFWASWVIFSGMMISSLVVILAGLIKFSWKKEDDWDDRDKEREENNEDGRDKKHDKDFKQIRRVGDNQSDQGLLQNQLGKLRLALSKKKGLNLKTGNDSRESLASRKDEKIETEIHKNIKVPKIDLPLSLLENSSEKPDSGNIKENQFIIQRTLENFSIPVEMGMIQVGPTVTQYTLKPADGVKLSKITTLHNDLAMALAAHPIRIEAPIPGQSLVGIEVPNHKKAIVRLKEMLGSESFKSRKSNLTIALGKDVAGNVWTGNIDKMPHALIAGSTGSGKTVMINSILISLIYQNSPEDLRLILIDPKRVELTLYNNLPHLLTPVITDVTKTINALKWSISEMDRRFGIMAEAKKRDIHSYNQANQEDKLPYIVIVIDELADLMMAAAQEVESCIIRLAQMARATGIHLIMATQRPSVDVITGLIKANITSRIAFSVAAMSDSRTILDYSGAEKLLGMGDMLYVSSELSKPKRLQGAYVSDEEIKKVVDYLKNISGPSYQEGITDFHNAKASIVSSDGSFQEDELLPDAKQVIIQAGKASASLLQRRLRVGYARAARLLDLLEEEGMIGPADGSKPRDVYYEENQEEAEILDN